MENLQEPNPLNEKKPLKIEIPLEDSEQPSETKTKAIAEQKQIAAETPKVTTPSTYNSASSSSNNNSNRSCLCSPTTHAGSFRCRKHRSLQKQWSIGSVNSASAAKKEQPLPSSAPKDVSSAPSMSNAVEAL
eukprot:TRINITY_DN867_c0_g1_i1.p1 TRINITY_DN867_c0_g1~~TRINITY_DN867_c0_g1_i1.p1  ORF type:complete len:132 (+),score=40.22 TRINITY_DN867_c0_g1_i1:93-488(+)